MLRFHKGFWSKTDVDFSLTLPFTSWVIYDAYLISLGL